MRKGKFSSGFLLLVLQFIFLMNFLVHVSAGLNTNFMDNQMDIFNDAEIIIGKRSENSLDESQTQQVDVGNYDDSLANFNWRSEISPIEGLEWEKTEDFTTTHDHDLDPSQSQHRLGQGQGHDQDTDMDTDQHETAETASLLFYRKPPKGFKNFRKSPPPPSSPKPTPTSYLIIPSPNSAEPVPQPAAPCPQSDYTHIHDPDVDQSIPTITNIRDYYTSHLGPIISPSGSGWSVPNQRAPVTVTPRPLPLIIPKSQTGAQFYDPLTFTKTTHFPKVPTLTSGRPQISNQETPMKFENPTVSGNQQDSIDSLHINYHQSYFNPSTLQNSLNSPTQLKNTAKLQNLNYPPSYDKYSNSIENNPKPFYSHYSKGNSNPFATTYSQTTNLIKPITFQTYQKHSNYLDSISSSFPSNKYSTVKTPLISLTSKYPENVSLQPELSSQNVFDSQNDFQFGIPSTPLNDHLYQSPLQSFNYQNYQNSLNLRKSFKTPYNSLQSQSQSQLTSTLFSNPNLIQQQLFSPSSPAHSHSHSPSSIYNPQLKSPEDQVFDEQLAQHLNHLMLKAKRKYSKSKSQLKITESPSAFSSQLISQMSYPHPQFERKSDTENNLNSNSNSNVGGKYQKENSNGKSPFSSKLVQNFVSSSRRRQMLNLIQNPETVWSGLSNPGQVNINSVVSQPYVSNVKNYLAGNSNPHYYGQSPNLLTAPNYLNYGANQLDYNSQLNSNLAGGLDLHLVGSNADKKSNYRKSVKNDGQKIHKNYKHSPSTLSKSTSAAGNSEFNFNPNVLVAPIAMPQNLNHQLVPQFLVHPNILYHHNPLVPPVNFVQAVPILKRTSPNGSGYGINQVETNFSPRSSSQASETSKGPAILKANYKNNKLTISFENGYSKKSGKIGHESGRYKSENDESKSNFIASSYQKLKNKLGF